MDGFWTDGRRAWTDGRRAGRYGAYAAVVAAVVFGAVLLWPETFAAHRLSDEPAHVTWVAWAADRIAAGHSPLDGWLPQLGMGAPQFHQYEVLAHIVAGSFAAATGLEAAAVVRWTMYLLLATWPIAVYLGARLLDRDRLTAAIAAVLAPLVASTPGFGVEWSSYLFVGNGLWAQVVAVWLFPLTIGLTWRAIDRGYGFAPAAALVAVSLCCHFFWGYVALIWLGVVVLLGPRSFVHRVRRGALVTLGGFAASAWLLVPLAVDFRWIGDTQYKNDAHFDSYGARQALEWLFTAKLLDAGRPLMPIITVLAFAGAGVSIARFRRDAACRVILTFTLLSFVIFFGRPTFGAVINAVPGLDEIPLHRFLGPVQIGVLLLAGIGGSAAIRAVDVLVRRVEPRRHTAIVAVLSLVGVLLLVPAAAERERLADHNGKAIRSQQASERVDGKAYAELVALATRRGGGRVFAGNILGGGIGFRVGQIPSYAEILINGGLGLGFGGRAASLSVDTELGFNPARLDHYSLYGVRYLILPSVGEPAVPSTRVATRGAYTLFEVGTGGYLRIADSVGPAIAADRSTLGDATARFVVSQLPARSGTRPIAFDGDTPARPTMRRAIRPSEPPGAVRSERHDQYDGVYRGSVNAQRRAVVVLAASYHPRWTATVDGKPAKTQMVAPSFVAVVVPRGEHRVVFRYEPYPGASYALLLALGIAALGALVVVDRRQRRMMTR